MTDIAIRSDPASETFARRVALANPNAVRASRVETLMLNVTLRCDTACPHCHQSSSPDRAEAMSHDVMMDSLRLAEIIRPSLIDVTGGEPALWPHLPELVERARAAGHPVRVRTNLSALARPECARLPAFFADNGVEILGSLPRSGASGDALAVLLKLTDLGYGTGDGLLLELAHNPPVGESPRDERELACDLHATLDPLGVRFDGVREIANVPVGRLARKLELEGTYRAEVDRLARAFNPDVVGELACRHGIDVAWDGALFDCDFNMGAGLPVTDGPRTLAEALALDASGGDVTSALSSRRIAFGEHCFACTVGAGSG